MGEYRYVGISEFGGGVRGYICFIYIYMYIYFCVSSCIWGSELTNHLKVSFFFIYKRIKYKIKPSIRQSRVGANTHT